MIVLLLLLLIIIILILILIILVAIVIAVRGALQQPEAGPAHAGVVRRDGERAVAPL